MNEEYLKEIYGYLGGENYADFETFSKDLSSNPEYNKQIFDYLYSGQEGVSYDAFSFDTGLKKKEPSASSVEPSRTQPTQQEQPSTSLAEDLGISEEELVPTRQEAQQLQQPILDTSDRLREGGQAPDLGSAIETDIRVNEDILRSAREGRPAEQESEFQFDEQVSISSDSEKPVQVEAEIEEPKLKPNKTTGVARSLAPAKQILPPFAQTSAAINFYDERVERDYVEAITSNKGKIKAIEKDLEAMGQPTQENASAYLELFDEYNKSATEQVLLLKEKLQFDYDKLIQKDFDERGGVRLAMETLPIGARFGFKAVGSLTAKAQKIAASGASWLAASKFLTTYEQDPNEPLLYREQATEMKQNFLAWARDMYESSRKTSKEYGLVNTIEEINDPLALADFAVTAISETMVDIPLALLTFGGSSYIQTYGNMFLEGLQTLSKEQGKPIEEIINTEEVDRAALNTASLIVAGLDRIGAGKVLGGANLLFMKDALKKNALKQSAIKRATGGALVEVGTENIQEAVEAGGEFASLGKDFIEGMARLDVDDYLNITAKTLFGAGAMSTVNTYMDNGKLTNEFLDVLSKATESELTYKALTSTILARQRAGIYTKEQAESRLQDLMSDIEANQSLPRSIKGDARVEAIGLQKEYNEVKEARDQASDAFKSMYNEELNNLEERLTNILRDETSKKDQELLEAEIRQENEQEKLREEEQTRNVVGDEKAVLEELSDGRVQEEGEQESTELRTEQEKIEEDVVSETFRVGKVTTKNKKGLASTFKNLFNLDEGKSKAVASVYESIINTIANRSNKSKGDVFKSISFKKADKAPDGSLKQESPVFKSTAKEGLSKIQQVAATPEQWLKMINDKGGRGTSQELDWIGLNDYLNEWKKDNNSKSVPKEVVEQYINDNQIEIVEVTKGSQGIKNKRDFLEQQQEEALNNEDYDGAEFYERELQRLNESATEAKDETKYSQYTLEGGENYREVLLTLPERRQNFTYKVEKTEGGWSVSNEVTGDWMFPVNLPTKEEAQKRADELNKQGKSRYDTKSNYKSSHWDESNILAHLRLNERTLPNGERVLFIEEVQSDWAQEGKKKGFANQKIDEHNKINEKILKLERKPASEIKNEYGDNIDDYFEDIKKLKKQREVLEKQIPQEYERSYNNFINQKTTPDMPYKKTDQWVGMAMRRAMQMAAQEGFDRVAWVTGEQSADRYDLSKQIDAIDIEPKINDNRYVNLKMPQGQNIVMTVDLNGNISESSSQFNNKNLKDVIGKELAEKVLSTPDNERRTLKGEGLKVGGEGMKAFYNSILPKVAGKEAKRFDKNAKVEVVEIEQKKKDDRYEKLIEKKKEFQEKADKSSGFVRDAYLEDAERTQAVIDKEYKILQQLSIAITPEMRMNLNSAVPLFQGEQGAMLAGDGNYIIYALTDPNVSTPLHELAHVYEHYLTEQERKDIIKWAGHKEWTTETSEKFARGFEKYLSEGKAPTPALQKYFDNFKNWLLEIYNGIVGSDIDIELNAPMRKIYDNMFSQDGAKKTTSIASETQGLTEKERFVQGFKEIMSAKDEKIRQAKESVKEKLSQARAKFGERMSAQRKKVSEAKTARAELGRLINLEMKELGLSDVRASRVKSMLSSMKNITPNNIDSVIERAYGLVVAEAKAQRLNTYKKKSKEAKRRIQRGDFDTVSVGMIPLMELDVRAILDEDIKRYTELVDDFSRRGKFAVEDVAAKIQEANEIVNRAAEQLGLREVEASNIAQGLTEENYNKAISELVASGDITQDMADFMRANKKRLLELEKKPVNKEQVFFEIQDKIEFVKNNQQDLSDRPVKQKAQDVISSVKREDLENMSDADLSLLNRVLDAMEVGLMPSQASKLEQTIEAQRTANSINKQTQQEKSTVGKVFDATDTPIRELASGKSKRVRRQMIKSQSTTVDSTFGFKGRAISKALEPFNIAYGELEAQANKYKGMLARAIKNIKKSQASDIRGFLYMAEMHRNANPQSNKAYTVKQLIDVLTGTTEARETYISNYGEKRYKEILKTYDKFKDENGELDAKKLYESMSKAERDYVSTAEIIFSENTEFARDARWVRGESFEELNYYMHYPVVMQASKSDVNASVDNMMNSGIVRPSTKAGNLEERTEGVKLVSFSLAESVQNSYQQTLEDYYLTQPLRTERKAFNMFEKMNSNNDEMFSFASGVNKGAEDFRRYLLVSKQVSNFNNPITNAIKAGAYRYMLGSTARAVKEVLSNQSYVAMSDLVNFETASFKSFEIAKKTLTEPDWLFKAVANLPISDKQRILGNAVFAGQADAATMLGEDVGFTARAQSLETRIGKGIEAMQDLGITVNIKGNRIRISNKAYMEALLKTPDMFYSRGVFFDKLQRAYKKETGESLDLDKLTDKKFINDNRVLFDKITKEASAAVRKAFSTTNLAERSGVQLKASAEGGMFNAVKYFMLPFVINEYEQLRMAAVEDGLFGGLKTAIPILSRFAVYGALTGALTRAIAAAVSDEDEPIEDILPSKDEFMKSLISSVVTLTLQRNWTFAPRAASNYVIEYLNKEFGEGITRESKEYDKFKDNIMFNRMNLDDVMGMRWTEMAQIIAPQYSPLLSSYEAAMKSTDERNKQRKEYLEWKALVTALAGLGFLPRDVRDIYIYSNEDVRDLIFEDKKKGVSGTIKGGSSSGALSGGRGTTIKGAAR